MSISRAVHGRAVLQALLVTFLWSTSWVLIKVGLADIPALTFAGLRYALATLCLLPLALRSGPLHSLRRQPVALWLRLILLGLLFYSVTQGAQFVSLAYLPAALVSLLLSFTRCPPDASQLAGGRKAGLRPGLGCARVGSCVA